MRLVNERARQRGRISLLRPDPERGCDIEILRSNIECCAGLTGAVVIIDVLRSFTTAAYAFAAKARAIYPAETIAKARALRAGLPGALTMGAAPGGTPIPDFDLSNCPSALVGRDLSGYDIIHCTGAGVRGIVAARSADALFAASLVCARATAHALRRLAPDTLTLVVTGDWSDRDGDEDHACADYLEALLRGSEADSGPFSSRVRASDFGRRYGDPRFPHLPASDLACCAEADRWNFAMRVGTLDGRLVIRPFGRDAAPAPNAPARPDQPGNLPPEK